MGLKPGDDCTLPMLNSLHQEQHRIGEVTFWRLHLPGDVLMRAVVGWANERYAAGKAGR